MAHPPVQRVMKIIRIDRGQRLKDVARALKMSSSYLSSIEVGERPTPSDFVEKVTKALVLNDQEIERLSDAVASSTRIFKLDGLPPERRQNLAAIFSTLLLSTDDELGQVRKTLRIKRLDWLPSKKV